MSFLSLEDIILNKVKEGEWKEKKRKEGKQAGLK